MVMKTIFFVHLPWQFANKNSTIVVVIQVKYHYKALVVKPVGWLVGGGGYILDEHLLVIVSSHLETRLPLPAQ